MGEVRLVALLLCYHEELGMNTFEGDQGNLCDGSIVIYVYLKLFEIFLSHYYSYYIVYFPMCYCGCRYHR